MSKPVGSGEVRNGRQLQLMRDNLLSDCHLVIAKLSPLAFIPARVLAALVEGLRIDKRGVTESG